MIKTEDLSNDRHDKCLHPPKEPMTLTRPKNNPYVKRKYLDTTEMNTHAKSASMSTHGTSDGNANIVSIAATTPIISSTTHMTPTITTGSTSTSPITATTNDPAILAVADPNLTSSHGSHAVSIESCPLTYQTKEVSMIDCPQIKRDHQAIQQDGPSVMMANTRINPYSKKGNHPYPQQQQQQQSQDSCLLQDLNTRNAVTRNKDNTMVHKKESKEPSDSTYPIQRKDSFLPTWPSTDEFALSIVHSKEPTDQQCDIPHPSCSTMDCTEDTLNAKMPSHRRESETMEDRSNTMEEPTTNSVDDEYSCDIDWNSIHITRNIPNSSDSNCCRKSQVMDTRINDSTSSQTESCHINSISSSQIFTDIHDVVHDRCASKNDTSNENFKKKQEIPLHHQDTSTLNRPVNTPQENVVLNKNGLSATITELQQILSYDKSRIIPVDDAYRQTLIENANINGVLGNGWTLLPHQKAGVLRALTMRRLILAYDMGLGKTLVGCVWARAFHKTFPSIRIYIICPISLSKEWERTAFETTGLVCEEDGKKRTDRKMASNTVDASTTTLPSCKVCSWAKIPLVPKNVEKYIVICDEAHNMQNMESGRTRDTLELTLSERCIGVLLLSGTPMKNGRPSNLFPLLKAVGHPFGDNQRSFEIAFCNGRYINFGQKKVWDASGSTNLSVLNAHITSHVLFKTKEDCLDNLPGKTREYKRVQVSSRFEIRYVNAMNELARVQNMIDQKTDDEIGSEAVLGAFTNVRLIASLAKIEATVALARSILEIESSIVVFTYFVQVAKEVHSKLQDMGWNGEILVGDVPAPKRQTMVDNFQSGVSPVFVATFGAGGVGITLTAACSVILLDRPWTPGDAFQAEDRVRRIGQTRPVKSIWMRGFDIDEMIDNLIEHKNHNSTTVVDGRTANASGLSVSNHAAKVSLRQLIKNMIAKNSVIIRGLQEIYTTSDNSALKKN